MEILIALAAAGIAAAAAWAARGRLPAPRMGGGGASRRGEGAPGTADGPPAYPGPVTAGAADRAALPQPEPAEAELRERRAEILRLEERILQREESLERRLAELARREQAIAEHQMALEGRARELERDAEKLRGVHEQRLREIERVAAMTRSQARQALLRDVESEARHGAAKMVRQIDEEARREGERRARNILAACMQRLAASHAAETTVSIVSLPSDDMKGRIIGREGRNIRALETITGVDVIIDETPSAVVLSSFDGVRREIAKLTLEKLLADGRIHPARVEEAYHQSRSEIENHIVEQGEQAMFEANVHGLHPELVKLLGRLKFRTSYGQNVLSHSIEVARLASMMADELGASAKTARRAALLHDIGKAVSHEAEGPHAVVGAAIARRCRESDAVAHAMEAHHNDVEMQTIEAVLVQTADALSGARPGVRGESLEHYIKRLSDLEGIAGRHDGVEKVYAMQAGREIRVMVAPGDVSDDQAALLSRDIAREIEREVEYPGQIKVTVIRESRAVDFAR